jgi:hypothetical protein
MFSLKKNEGFDNILRMIGEQTTKKVNHSSEIEKILNSLKLTMKNWKTDTGMYSIIKYDKLAFGMTQEDYATIGLLRSVVVDEMGRIVAYSPPKCLSVTEEREKSFNDNNIMSELSGGDSDTTANRWCAEEFVEGTMINMFYSKTDAGEAWEIATKSTVGGNVVFYSPKNPKDNVEIRDKDTFRNMFFETCAKLGFKYEELPKEFMYSFVLQHPKNRIVLPITDAKIYIIGVYSINNDTLDVTSLSTAGFVEKYGAGVILRPKQLFADNYTVDGFKKEYASMNSSYNMMGVVFCNMETGVRMKVRNPTYEMVKNLKGVDQKLQLQYLTLRHGGRVADYLKTYSEYKGDFAVYRNQLHGFTRSLHENYLDCFVFKKRKFIEFPQQYKKFMFGLHKKYLEELREIKGSVTFNYVVDFVNTQNPLALLYSLNHVVRQHKKTIEMMDEVPLEPVAPVETVENVNTETMGGLET